MITLVLFNFLFDMVGQVLVLLPPLPAGWSGAVGQMTSSAASLAVMVSKLGILVPFDTIGMVIGWWLWAVGFWAAMIGVRLVLWGLGR